MSQDSQKSPRNDRRKSILVQKQIEEVVKNHRRVSFRNVKEVQFFDKDFKNNPDLLHDASPLKEKINDTLGSDGIFTPGRTGISDASSHSSKNNTADMFGDTARKPNQAIPIEELARFEIQGTPPMETSTNNITSMSAAEMSIANSTLVKEVDMSITRDVSQLDDTLQLFSRSSATINIENKENLDSTSDETLQMFPNNETTQFQTENSMQIENSAQNETIDMFNQKASDVSKVLSPPPSKANDTMDIFKSPVRDPIKGARISMSNTLAIFESPMNQTVDRTKRVSMSTTMAMFADSPGEKESSEKMNETAQMFSNTSLLQTTDPPGAALERSIPMDITQAIFDTTEGEEDQTNRLFREEKLINITEVGEEFRVGTPTFNMFQNSGTILLSPNERSMNTSRQPSSQECAAIMSKTLEALMTTTEKRASAVFETARAMNFTMNYSDMIERVENIAPIEKSLHLQEKDSTAAVENISMDASLNFSANKSKRASILSQSIRSRKRSSLNSTLLDLMPTSTPPPTLNSPKEEQLSFVMRSSLFDGYSTQVSYPEAKTEITKKIHNEGVLDLQKFILSETQTDKNELERAISIIKKKMPGKVSAIETLNSRKLGPLDADIMMAARNLAESDWLQKRIQVAKSATGQYQKINATLKPKLLEVEKKALICEGLSDLKEEVKRLESEWSDLAGINLVAIKEGEEEHHRLVQEIRTAERQIIQQKIQNLQTEEVFLQKKMKEADQIYKILLAAQREKRMNEQLIKERLRNYDFNLANEEPIDSSMEEE